MHSFNDSLSLIVGKEYHIIYTHISFTTHIMGIRELLRHLLGGKQYKYGFMDLGLKGKKVPIDAAGVITNLRRSMRLTS